MSAFPFHVAGGFFAAPRPETIDVARLLPGTACAPVEATTKTGSSRRRKLWEVPHKFHCPIVGSCFEVAELRALMNKLMHLPRDTSDFVLHTTAVGTCETRTELAELLHKTLEKRYHLTVKHFAATRTADGLRTLWRDAVRNGTELPAALWAAWTHPACDTLLEQDIYGDIHMVQHQVGTGARADLKALQSLRDDNAELRRQLDAARREAEAARQEKADETRALSELITELRAAQVGRDACIARLTAQLDQLRSSLPDLKDRQALARRADDAEARALALTAQCRSQSDEIEALGAVLRKAEAEHARPCAGETTVDTGSRGETLDGKCVLCVGGRSGTVDAYRDVVERHGGRFLHHDGGQEESFHRINAALATADLVVCQAGCISHNAYWRVKEQCKRTGKPCIFLKGSGVTSFGRLFAQLQQTALGIEDSSC